MPDALADAPLASVRAAVRQLAEAQLDTIEAQSTALERDRAVLAALLTRPPTGDA
ncbi:MAG: hypothetical protein SangKO_099390 [Sandaracinaceae bacterium]